MTVDSGSAGYSPSLRDSGRYANVPPLTVSRRVARNWLVYKNSFFLLFIKGAAGRPPTDKVNIFKGVVYLKSFSDT